MSQNDSNEEAFNHLLVLYKQAAKPHCLPLPHPAPWNGTEGEGHVNQCRSGSHLTAAGAPNKSHWALYESSGGREGKTRQGMRGNVMKTESE